MNNSMRFTKEEIQFIEDNVTTKGIPYCCQTLGRSYSSITHVVVRNNLSAKKSVRKKRKSSTHKYPNHLRALKTPEAVYTAGFIWGDGHLYSSGNGINISIKEEDGLDLTPIFNVANEWDLTIIPKRRDTWSNQTVFTNHDVQLYSLFVSMNYLNKSGGIPDLSKIPPDLLHHWYLGLSDADGCFYNKVQGSTCQYTLSSCIGQDWSHVETLLKNLDINYQIQEQALSRKDTTHSSSNLRFQGVSNITKWGSYIYQTYGQDGIGLLRKHNKYIEGFRFGRRFT